MTPLICDAPSFNVKYRCPVFQTRQFESSPSTQTSKNSCSRRSRTRTVSSVTLSTRRGWTLGAAGTGALEAGSGSSSGSSSNRRSNRSAIREIRKLLKFIGAEADAFDVRRATGLFVGLDDNPVQPRIAGGRLEFLRQRRQKPVERRFHLDADDRVVRPRHADVGE